VQIGTSEQEALVDAGNGVAKELGVWAGADE